MAEATITEITIILKIWLFLILRKKLIKLFIGLLGLPETKFY
jgi:hypothetical protein